MEVVFLTKAIKEFHPNANLILCGDLNRNKKSTENLAKTLNLRCVPYVEGSKQWTRKSQGSIRNCGTTLDYFLSNCIGKV